VLINKIIILVLF